MTIDTAHGRRLLEGLEPTPTDMARRLHDLAHEMVGNEYDEENYAARLVMTASMLLDAADKVAEKGDGSEKYWLIERRCSPPLWISSHPASFGSQTADVDRAWRYPSKREAQEAMRGIGLPERAEFFPSEHIWIDGALTASPDPAKSAEVPVQKPLDYPSKLQSDLNRLMNYESATAQPTPRVEITEEMVERAFTGFILKGCEISRDVRFSHLTTDEIKGLVRAALTAAFQTGEGALASTATSTEVDDGR